MAGLGVADLFPEARHALLGDPQQLLLMKIRPESIMPRVDYASQAQAVLRIQDSFLFQNSASGAGGATGTHDTQTWEIRLCPSGPTKFALQCDQGDSSFDFTDFQVRGVDIRADGTRLEEGFSRPYPVTLEAFNARVTQGSFRFRGMIDARAKAIALYVPKTSCRFEITGKAFEGESAITFQGVPSEIELVVSRKVGVRITGAAMLKEALAFVGAIDRLPLPVKSSPGFLVNRALTPYMLEAMMMLDEKTDQRLIDAAAVEFGMPMGPIELADQVGLDICLDVGDMLRSKFGDALLPTPAWLREKVANGELGRETGNGFYTWKDGKAEKAPLPETGPKVSDEMIDRLVLPISNVCVAALREGIVDDPDMVDGAMIFGTGFAPFRGGPLNYAGTRGVDSVVSALRALTQKFGDRFAPDAGWETFK